MDYLNSSLCQSGKYLGNSTTSAEEIMLIADSFSTAKGGKINHI